MFTLNTFRAFDWGKLANKMQIFLSRGQTDLNKTLRKTWSGKVWQSPDLSDIMKADLIYISWLLLAGFSRLTSWICPKPHSLHSRLSYYFSLSTGFETWPSWFRRSSGSLKNKRKSGSYKKNVQAFSSVLLCQFKMIHNFFPAFISINKYD